MKTTKSLLLALSSLTLPLSAVIIGTDDFAYLDGDLAINSGGTGWSFNFGAQDQSNSGGIAAWENAGFVTAPTVATEEVVTNEDGALRHYGADMGNGAVQGSGQLFYKVEMTRSGTATWCGVSHMGWGTERVKFGATGADDLPAIEVTAGDVNGTTQGTVPYVDGQTYTIIGVVDFDNDLLGLFIDPDGTDYWTSGGLNSADVTRTFTNNDWSSSVRLASGGIVTWDNLTAATAPSDVGLQDFVDADGDGLPADWENAHDLDDNDDGSIILDNGADGNPDTDGLTNREEYDGLGIAGFDGGTDPRNQDSDDDGLFDGPEVLTYTTNPLDPDHDDDELKDGAEVNTHFTDPKVADTDSGGTNDGTEIALGTLPQIGNGGDDLATNGNADMIGQERFDYEDGSIDGRTGGDGFDTDNLDTPDAFTGHTGIPADWDTLWGDPQVVCQRLRTWESGALRQFNGLAEGAGSSEASGAILLAPGGTTQVNDIIWVKFDLIRSSGAVWSGLSIYEYGTERLFIGVTSAAADDDYLSYEEPGGSSGIAPTAPPLADGESNTIVARIDPVAGQVDIYLNPILAGPEPEPLDDADLLGSWGGSDITAIRCASGGSGPTDWDNIIVAGSWDGLSIPAADSDVDGLRDSFEAGFSVTDAGGHDDDDTLTNLQEQTNGTNPKDADSDNDDVDDDDEVNGSLNPFPTPKLPTDPCNPDSDGDGINDGAEISGSGNTYDSTPTNPNLADGDGDGFDDPVEIATGTDPNDNASNPTSEGLIVVDGSIDVLYPAALTVQTIQTGFGTNNQLDAAYAYVNKGKLCLLITGNIQDNFNKLEVFLDTGNQIATNVFTSAGNDNAGNMNGMIFDTVFRPEYHLILRRGWDGSTNKFDLDIANLATSQADFYGSLFGDSQTGSGATGTGTVNSSPIQVAYDDSNTAGIGANAGDPADQVAAAAVSTGVELCIELSDIGNPADAMRVMVLINNPDHNHLSNQSLAGLPETYGNLGNPTTTDFSTFPGDQFFTVTLPGFPDLAISPYNSTLDQVTLIASDVPAGETYHIRTSTTGDSWSPLAGSEFTTDTSIPYGPVLGGGPPALLFQIWSGPLP